MHESIMEFSFKVPSSYLKGEHAGLDSILNSKVNLEKFFFLEKKR